VRFVVEQDGIIFNGIGFNLAEKYITIPQEDTLDLIFTLDENTYNQQTSLQLKVIDVVSSHTKK
jgi:single-stranded-DNA-specific exonuclease